MLYLRLGACDRDALYGQKYISHPSEYFDFLYDASWLSSQFVKRVVKEVDGCEVISDSLVRCPVNGNMSPKELSMDSKVLILLYAVDDIVMCGEQITEECWPLIFEMALLKDIHIAIDRTVSEEYLPQEIEFYLENTLEYWCGEYTDYLYLCDGVLCKTREQYWKRFM